MQKVLIFGAGISGVTAARIFAEKDYQVEIYEKNSFVGGNVFDYFDNGILVHKFGPHIFHTNSDKVWDFVQRFAEFFPYEHRVLGKIDGKLVPIPFNLTSLFSLFPTEKAEYIQQVLTREVGLEKKVPILELMKNEDKTIVDFAKYVYEKVFFNYTQKQWGFSPENLPKTVTARVPVYISKEDRYFVDKHQAMPTCGFTKMLQNMLDHKNINLHLNCSPSLTFENGNILVDNKICTDKILYCGCLDELVNFKFGKLPYRSLNFVFEDYQQAEFQPVAVVNYPNEEKYTRISEFSKFTCKPTTHTIIVKEYPMEHIPKQTIPYYPIERQENRDIYQKYLDYFADYKNFVPLGRLGTYKYINMDVAIEKAMELSL